MVRNVKVVDDTGLGIVAQQINKKLTQVSSMPQSPALNTIVLYVGTTTSSYTQGGIYQYDGTNWNQINQVNIDESKIAPVETTTTASQAYAVGDLFIYNGTLYRVTTAIANGETIVTTGVNANCVETSISETFVRKTGDTMTGGLTVSNLTVGSRDSGSVGTNSASEGQWNIASGDNSHAEGESSQATGYSSHAEGNATISYGAYSHSEGSVTRSNGYASHAEGQNTTAGYDYQHVSGKYNNNKQTNAFEVGNGHYNRLTELEPTYSNALELTWTGDLSIAGDFTDGNGKSTSTNDFDNNYKNRLDNLIDIYSIGDGLGITDGELYTDMPASTYDSDLIVANAGGIVDYVSGELNDKQDIIQYSTMPTATSSNVNSIVQFIGTTTLTYTNGYFYKCVENNGTYSWQAVNVQAGGSGSGDMQSSVYDSTSAVANAGGIAAYVAANHQDISGKADKVTLATNGNFAALDANGNLTDSGHKHSDYLTQHQDITGKADKVSGATNGNFAGLDSNGNLTDSGKKAADFLNEIRGVASGIDGAVVYQQTKDGTNWDNKIAYVKGWSDKADKVTGATSGNFAGLDANGNLIDSGHKHSDYLTQHQDISDRYSTGDTAETALADDDYVPFYDTSKVGKRKTFWGNIKNVLKTYFDTLYSTVTQRENSVWHGTSLSLVYTGDMYEWDNKVSASDISLETMGTPSSSNCARTYLIVQGGGWIMAKWMEISDTSSTTYTFTNSDLTTSSVIDVYTDTYGDNPNNVAVSSGTCTVTFPSAKTRTVRIYIK